MLILPILIVIDKHKSQHIVFVQWNMQTGIEFQGRCVNVDSKDFNDVAAVIVEPGMVLAGHI
jgi:hypothetical protein